MNNPFSQSKVTYKISFTTYFKQLEKFEDIINNIFEDTLLALSTHEQSSQTINSLPQDIWLIEVYLSDMEPGDSDNLIQLSSLANLTLINQISIEEIADADWVSIYQTNLKPIEIDNFFISSKIHLDDCPKDKKGIFIEASRAFGTGDHATTSGCIEALTKLSNLKFDSIIDVGCGTGILSFVAKHFWPDAHVLGCDIEEVAVGIASDNAKFNNLNIKIYQNSENEILKDPYKDQKFDLITSNILAGPLVAMASEMRALASDNAYIILAGFLNTQSENVRASFEAQGFQVSNIILKDSWVIITMNL
jgi:ribosomal protein L11 methyltransferase